MILHTVNKSPFERNTLESCMRLVNDGSGVLLLEDGVYGAVKGTAIADIISSRMTDIKFYVLGPDVQARGMSETPLIDGIEVVDYKGFVDLVAKYDATQAWL